MMTKAVPIVLIILLSRNSFKFHLLFLKLVSIKSPFYLKLIYANSLQLLLINSYKYAIYLKYAKKRPATVGLFLHIQGNNVMLCTYNKWDIAIAN